MTARHQIRIGSRRIGRDRATIDATPAPSLGETLQIARERKGVDLFRAERDTKIRFKYLAALEDSHFDDLPAAVYTKGFLRNYAIYLGLDPEEVLDRWRDEMAAAQGRKAERPVVVPPPRPIAVPRRSFTISGGWLVAALVLMAVIGFVAYIGVQMMRFIETPAVSLTNPRSLVSQVEAESIMLSGASGPGALVTIHGPGGLLLNTTADEKGSWSREVPLSRGQNDFTVVANDPVTRRDSPELHVIVTVPLLGASPGVSSPSDAPPELRLGLVDPADGATVEGGELTVSGSTSGTRITIAAELLAPNAAESPSPGTGGPAPAERDVSVPTGGTFSETIALEPGTWRITVSAHSSGLQPVSESRTVTVVQPDEFTVVIEATRGSSWLRIVPDGYEPLRGWGGPTLERGSSVTVSATTEIFIRAGNAGALRITQDGVNLGRLGRGGEVGNWILRPGMEPERTNDSR